MGKHWLITIFFLSVLIAETSAQKFENLRIHVGLYAFESEVKDNSKIRAIDGPSASYVYTNNRFNSVYQSVFGGLSAERNLAPKWSVSGGLQYARISGHLEVNALYDGPDYFYYRYREVGTTTEYFRIREFQQNSHYIGLPLDLRFSPLNGNFKLTLRAGTELNYRLTTGGSVDFVDREMQQYEGDMFDSFTVPDRVNVFVIVGAGISFGKPGKVSYGFEVAGPCVSATQHAGGMFSPSAGAGFSLFLKVPLNTTEHE